MDDKSTNTKMTTESSFYSKQEYEEADDFQIIKLFEDNKNKVIENIICVELINNNKLYIKYEEDWTIEKVLIL